MRRWIKRESGSEQVLSVMIWAILSLLSTRLFLQLAGWPQIGGGVWHISHMFFGGLAMIAGMIITLTVHGERARRLATVIFGLGTGLFIDQVGKILSADYDYFFRPAAVFIYIFFIVLFMIYRFLERNSPKEPRAMLYDVIDRLEEIAEGDLEKSEREQLAARLARLGKSRNKEIRFIAGHLREMIEKIKYRRDRPESWDKKLWREIKKFSYHKVFKRKLVLYLLIVLALVYGISGLIDTWFLASRFRQGELLEFYWRGFNIFTRSDITLFTMKTGADLLSSVMFLLGIWEVINRRPKRGIYYFQYGLLFNIFLSSVFRFYFEQFSGVFGVAFSIGLFTGLSRLRKELV